MTIFARRHYQAIAEELKKCYYSPFVDHPSVVNIVTRSLITMFEKDNPNFKRERFLKACGMEEGS